MGQQERWKPEDRVLYLNGEIADEPCQAIIERLLQNWNREFLLVINSDGGCTSHALALINLMEAHGRVDTVCVGVAMSGAADILSAGRRRYIVPGAIAMLHQVSWELGREFAANLVKNAQYLDRLNQVFAERLSRKTGHSVEKLNMDMATDFYLFDREIIDYGLADDYWKPAHLLPAQPSRPSGRIRAEIGELRQKRVRHPRDDER